MPTALVDQANITAILKNCTVLGGFGYPFGAGDIIELGFSTNHVLISGPDGRKEAVAFIEVLELTIAGPGNVRTGGSFVGGGFGAEGAIEGIAIAAVLNSLTSKSKIHTDRKSVV